MRKTKTPVVSCLIFYLSDFRPQLQRFQKTTVDKRWKKICKIFHGLRLFAKSIMAVISWSKVRCSVVGVTLIKNCLKILTAYPLPYPLTTNSIFWYVNFHSHAKAYTATEQSLLHSFTTLPKPPPVQKKNPFTFLLFFCYLELILKSSWGDKWH